MLGHHDLQGGSHGVIFPATLPARSAKQPRDGQAGGVEIGVLVLAASLSGDGLAALCGDGLATLVEEGHRPSPPECWSGSGHGRPISRTRHHRP
jgi:hypothetical protein